MRKLEDILLNISNLLNNNDEKDLAIHFKKLQHEAAQCHSNYDVDFIIKIKGMFGGMGSFNDLVLHKNSKPLKGENMELDKLSKELFEKCKELRLAKNSGKVIDF